MRRSEPREPFRKISSFLEPGELARYEAAWQQTVEQSHNTDLAAGIVDCRTLEQYNDVHCVDFIEDVIPAQIRRLEPIGRPVNVLDSGCGMGLFNDQVRAKFGPAVNVSGTNLSREVSGDRRKKILAEMRREQANSYWRSGLIYIKDTAGLKTLSDSMHSNDGKWRSVLEMSTDPEFDLIIDTYGELFYTFMHYYVTGDAPIKPPEADRVLDAMLRKLQVGGELYASSGNASLGSDHFFNKLWLDGGEIEQSYGVEVKLAGIPRSDIFSRVIRRQPNADPKKLEWDQGDFRAFLSSQQRHYMQTVQITRL